jgi:hypothetical protein
MSTSISLIAAAKVGDESLIKQHLGTGVDPEKEKDTDGGTAMHAAASHDHATAIELLHKKGAKLDTATKKGWTPLMEASFRGHTKSLETLIGLGANPEGINEYGYTARALALFRGYKSCSELIPSDEYTEEFTQRKILAHFNGIGGQSWIGSRSFTLTGAFSPLMHEYVATDFESFLTTQSGFLSNQNKKKLLHAFRAAAKIKTADEWTASIQSGNLTILPAGWDSHAIDLVFYQNYMAICNRGEGIPKDSKTIDTFVIDRSKIDAKIIQKILDQKTLPASKASEFFYNELPKLLNSEGKKVKDDLCKRSDSIAPKPIKIGICTAGGAKASLRFSIWILRAFSYSRFPPVDFEKTVVRFVKDWSIHSRIERIYYYCTSHFKNSEEESSRTKPSSPDLGLVRNCLYKLGRRIYKQEGCSLLSLFKARFAGLKRTYDPYLKPTYRRYSVSS